MRTLSFHDFAAGWDEPLLELKDEVLGPGLYLILAPNGLGKSTFLQVLSGLKKPLKGYAQLDKVSLHSESQVHHVSEYLTFPKFIYPKEWITTIGGDGPYEKWVEAFRLGHKMDSFVGFMSQGERRKVAWLTAIASKKEILCLDEPFDGLDLYGIEAGRSVLEEWKREDRFIFLITHQAGEVFDLADQILLLKNQKIHNYKDDFGAPGNWEDVRSRVLKFYS